MKLRTKAVLAVLGINLSVFLVAALAYGVPNAFLIVTVLGLLWFALGILTYVMDVLSRVAWGENA